jgi:methyl-accepting chemotaxis protein
MAAMYFDYKFLVVASVSVILTNIILFLFGKDIFFNTFDIGNFISYIVALGCSAGAITYSVKRSIELLNNSRKNEEELHELITKTKEVYHTIDSSVEGLYAKTSQTVTNSNEIISKIQDISNGSASQIDFIKKGVNLSNTLRQNTESIRENADIMHDSAIKIVQMSKDGGSTLDVLINKQQDNASHIDKIYNAAQTQSETIKEISVFTEMIMSIAKS